jgi:integrase
LGAAWIADQRAILKASTFHSVESAWRPEDLVLGDGDTHLILPNSKDGRFAAAVRRCQLKDSRFPWVTPHDLRHTTASLAISAGANVKAVSQDIVNAGWV